MTARKTPRNEMRQGIIEMGSRNLAPCNIAARLGTTTKYVKEALRMEGIEYEMVSGPYAVEATWGRSGHDLRMAIWKRARIGAQRAREAMSA